MQYKNFKTGQLIEDHENAPAGWGVDVNTRQFVKKTVDFEPYDAKLYGQGGTSVGGTITLANGQRISPQDPNYATYARQFGIIPQSSSTAPISGTSQEGVNLGLKPHQVAQFSSAGPITTQQVTLSQPTDQFGLTGVFKELFDQLKNQLDQLQKRGQIINPSVQITPEKVAEFTRQAQGEIDPFYSTQLKTAREGFLRSLGFSTEQLIRQEQDLERKFGESTRQIGEQAAETGFTLSGRRQRAERDLAVDTQQAITENRRQLQFQAGTSGREFAGRFGGSALSIPRLSGAPTVSPGETVFGRNAPDQPLYELSPEVYSGLKGTEQFEQEAVTQRRARELEELFRSQEMLKQQRALTF